MSFARPAVPAPKPRALGWSMLFLAAFVFAIVVVGGITRLTESGLSITEWKPIHGIIPPLTQADWQAEFEGYKRIPQYAAFNTGMTLEGFKSIYFWEYLHRLLARTIGTVLLVILAVAWWKRAIPAGYGRRMVVIFLLGGLQGVIGWWMVYSGLSVRTEVSHIRLAIHLLAALLIFSALIWTALDLFALARTGADVRSRLRWPAGLAIAALAIQILFGAFTAGLRAGYAFASWPRMGDEWFPQGGWQAALGVVGNVVDNPIVVQFVHRWWAWVTLAALLLLARKAKDVGATAEVIAIAGVAIIQILLGIATLLLGVPIVIAVAHQAVAALLLAAAIAAAHRIGRV
ncbi:COX15/CtaA family protein [Sphingomonas montanisoli]|uniref:Heme A synthase n=1 Tax=Sphingomonas montanisoli TaxID=2606412 RepID=A0A5D9C4Y2_9SPHN|nr:COX15/CtaA family protein [Sphingomonas montanisoli]TZG25035.1 heme A synthase [Sphingomonas montanisoli]